MSKLSFSLDFTKMRTVELTCLYLQCSPDLLRDVLDHPEKYYKPIRIRRRKRSSVPRVVFEIAPALRRIHRSIALGLRPFVMELPAYVQGFCPRRSIVGHAARHCDKPVVVVADIEDFFGNVRMERVIEVFEGLGCVQRTAVLLARLCTHKGSLPQGGRASPALANLAATPLDQALVESFGRESTYSRYADDLAFSGETAPSQVDLAAVLESFGFTLREGSYKLQKRASGQYVTGLSVVEDRPRAPRRVRRGIETDVRFASKLSMKAHLAYTLKREPSSDEVTEAIVRLMGRIVSWGNVEKSALPGWVRDFNAIPEVSTKGKRILLREEAPIVPIGDAPQLQGD